MNNKNNSKNINKSTKINNKNNYSIYSVNEAILKYIETVINPKIVENGQQVNVPVKYAMPERFISVKRDSYFHDVNTKQLILPLIVITNSGIKQSDNFSINNLDYEMTIPVAYNKNKNYSYDKLIPHEQKPNIAYYKVLPFKYVEIEYDITIITVHKTQLDLLLTDFMFHSKRYWSVDNKNFYHAVIDSFSPTVDTINDKRINQLDMKLTILAKILPETYLNKNVIQDDNTVYKINVKTTIVD